MWGTFLGGLFSTRLSHATRLPRDPTLFFGGYRVRGHTESFVALSSDITHITLLTTPT